MTKDFAAYARRFENAATFQDHIKLALEFYKQPDVLERFSPLARPYLLYRSAATSAANGPNPDWGEALVTVIRQGLEQLWGGGLPESHDPLVDGVEAEAETARAGRYAFFILELNYLKSIYRPHPRSQVTIYNDILYISRATHNRHLKESVDTFSQILLRLLRPAVRLERPRRLDTLVGRGEQLRRCQAMLGEGMSLSLVGPGGVGKTTLGTTLSTQTAGPDAEPFWYTFRPGFNDALGSLLFALGTYLHRRGRSGLWHQLVIEKGGIDDPNLALGLALADIEGLVPRPFLCFDEIDLLEQGIGGPNGELRPAHKRLLDFIKGLVGTAPLILIGHRAVVETDTTVTVEPFGKAEIREWLARLSISATDQVVAQLLAYTEGNPRLISLALALHLSAQGEKPTDSLKKSLDALPADPALGPIWNRLRERLTSDEIALLEAVSVFRGVAPADGWERAAVDHEKESRLLDSLADRQLLQRDGQGGVYLIPTLRTVILERQTIEMREQRHLQAALLLGVRGEFTESAYHYKMSGRPAEAINVWYPQMETEIGRGQAERALALFEDISARQLKPALQKRLILIRSELNQMRGEPARVVQDMRSQKWSNERFESIEAYRIWGEALQTQGQIYEAEEVLDQGLDVVTHLLRKYSYLHVQRSRLFLQQREISSAQREADLARFHTENMHGAIQYQIGNHDLALTHYEAALQIALKLDDQYNIGRTQYYLANVFSRMQRFEEAYRFFEEAIKTYRRVGDRVQAAHVRSNLAACLMLSESYEEAIEQASEALAFYQRSGNSYWIALNASNLAESYFHINDYRNAQQFAELVLNQEERDVYPYATYTLGLIHHVKDEVELAEKLFMDSINTAELNEDIWLLAYAHRSLGELYAKALRVDEGRQCLAQALKAFSQMKIGAEVEKTKKMIDALG